MDVICTDTEDLCIYTTFGTRTQMEGDYIEYSCFWKCKIIPWSKKQTTKKGCGYKIEIQAGNQSFFLYVRITQRKAVQIENSIYRNEILDVQWKFSQILKVFWFGRVFKQFLSNVCYT